jgi:hypothetical protein
MPNSWIENLEVMKQIRAEIAVLREEVLAMKHALESSDTVNAAAVNAVKQDSEQAREEAAEGIADILRTVCENGAVIVSVPAGHGVYAYRVIHPSVSL